MLKLNRADLMRPTAEEQVDQSFAARIAAEIGPLGTLHLLKRFQAEAGVGALLDGDTDAIKDRAARLDFRLAELDRQRRLFKAQIRAAATVADIHAILAQL